MGERLKKLQVIPDLIISSTAKRAKQTAKKIAAAIGYDESRIQWYDKLYHCIPQVFEETIYEVDDTVNTVFIVAHNPGITQFANELSPRFNTDNMPTCAVVGARMKLEHWTMFANCTKEVFLFDCPKKGQ